MKEDLSTLTDASLPVRPNSTLFMCVEKAAAVYTSPFFFCGETKKQKKTNNQEREREKVNICETWDEWWPENIPARVFFQIIHLAKDVVWTANHPVQGFLAR